MRALRTIQLDASDTFVFESHANPGEWAVSGAFVFAHTDISALTGKRRAEFRAGFLGIDSLGWSTLAQVVDVTQSDRASAIDLLARRLVERFGAPGLDVASAAAEEEIDFAMSLAQQPTGMLVAVARTLEGTSIKEAFRSLHAAEPKLPGAYAFLQASSGDEAIEDAEKVDLLGLATRRSL
jgi:Family of unknown function (DUF6505)